MVGFTSWPGGRRRASAVTAALAMLLTVGTSVAATARGAAADSVVATIPVAGDLMAVAVNATGTDAYVLDFGYIQYGQAPGRLWVVNLSTDKVTAVYTVGMEPTSVAVNPADTKAYVTNFDDQTVSVIDLASHAIATINLGFPPLGGIVVNPAGTKAYVADWFGKVAVIDLATDKVTSTIKVGTELSDLVLNPAGTKAYVTDFTANTLSVIDLATDTVTSTINVPEEPGAVAVNPDGTNAYVATGDTLAVVDLATRHVTATIDTGSNPNGVVVNPAGTHAYVADSDGSTMSVIDLATDTVAATINVGPNPVAIALNPAGTAAYIAGNGDGDGYGDVEPDAYGTLSVVNVEPGDAPSDIALTVTGPNAAADGTTFTEAVTVANHGPSDATGVATNLSVPAGLTVTAAPGATFESGTLDWIDQKLASATSVTHHVSFTVGTDAERTATIGGVTEGVGYDPDTANNVAATVVRLGSHRVP